MIPPMKIDRIARTLVLLLLAGALLFLIGGKARAEEEPQTADGTSVQRQIEEKNQEIKRLEVEAGKYRATLDEIGKAADTLQSQIASLERAIKGLDANIRLTNARIARANLEIRELAAGIQEKEASIGIQRGRLGYLMTSLAASDSETPLEILMKHETLSSFFASVDALLGVQRDLVSLLAELRSTRQDLKERKTTAESKRLELAGLVEDLADQKALQEQQRKDRAQLLSETKSQERRYQELLSEVERKREALQQEINSLESGLQANFDPSAVPAPGKGILGWPLPNPIFITQYFGKTSFARSGAYNGNGHNGIDLRAAVGTPVFASERGTVRRGEPGRTYRLLGPDRLCHGAAFAFFRLRAPSGQRRPIEKPSLRPHHDPPTLAIQWILKSSRLSLERCWFFFEPFCFSSPQ